MFKDVCVGGCLSMCVSEGVEDVCVGGCLKM